MPQLIHLLYTFMCCSKNQQYDSKWYIPLTELTFQGPEETEPLTIPQVPDEELDAMKVKISHLRSEIQREKVAWLYQCIMFTFFGEIFSGPYCR